MTNAQREAAQQITHLMREHFEGGVAILVADNESNDLLQDTDVLWHGGFAQAIGLLRVAEKRLFSKQTMTQESP